MVGVEPGQFIRRQNVFVDEAEVDGRQRDGFERHELALRVATGHRLGLAHHDQVLDADAVFAVLVIAGLVGADHAGLQRLGDGVALGDALRPFMHRQVAADAMAGAVIVVEAGLPQRIACERVERGAGRAFGEARGGQRDVALQHAGEAVLHLRRRLADDHGARHVGGAVRVLSAAVDQEHLVLVDRAVGRVGDAVMHHRAVRAGAGDRVERQVAQGSGAGAEAFEGFRRIDLGQAAVRRLARQPVQEVRQRGAVADMRLARAFDLDRVLAGLGQLHRIGGALDLRAGLVQAVEDRGGGGGGIGDDGLALQRIERRREIGRPAQAHRIAQMQQQLR